MSIGSILCKLWRFIVKVATAIVDGIAGLLKSIISLVVEVLSDLISGAGSLLGDLIKNPLVLIVGGVALWWLLSSDSDDEPQRVEIRGGYGY